MPDVIVTAVMDRVEATVNDYIEGSEPGIALMLAFLRAELLVDVEDAVRATVPA